jgi:hypothetical protein
MLPSTWPRPPQGSAKGDRAGLSNPQRNYLFHLADVLRISGEESLAARVERYLEADMNGKKFSPAKRYMKIMARSVVEAMHTGALLRGALTRKPGKACDVFVDKQSSSIEIFTSWHNGIDIDSRWRKSHVSLTFKSKTMNFAPVGHREVGERTVLPRAICQDQGHFQVATRMDRK